MCRHADEEQDINMYDLANSKVQNRESLLLDKEQGLPRTRGSISKATKNKADHTSGTNGPKEKRRKDIGKDVGDVKEGTSAYVTVQTSDSFTQREVQAGVDTGPTLFMKPPRDPAQTFIQATEPRAATAPRADSRTGGNRADASYSSSDMEAVSSSTRSNRRRQAD